MHNLIDKLQAFVLFAQENSTLLEISGAGLGAITALEIAVSWGMKIVIGVIAGSYMIWKWRKEAKKYKKEGL